MTHNLEAEKVGTCSFHGYCMRITQNGKIVFLSDLEPQSLKVTKLEPAKPSQPV